jgi:hypothetical protein
LLVATNSDPNGKQQVRDTELGSSRRDASKHEKKISLVVKFSDVLKTEVFR